MKPSEEGISNGLITRFWNMGPAATQSILKFSKPIKKVWKTTHIETNEKALQPSKGTLQFNFRANQMSTYRIVM